MTELQKEFEKTGYNSWINLDLYPNGKISTQEYTDWLEKELTEARTKLKNNGGLGDVVGQSKQLPDDLNYHDPLDDADDPRTMGLSNG